MFIRRVKLRGLRALRVREDVLASAGAPPPGALCVRGPNGAGKSTYLAVVAELWQWFRRCARRRAWVSPTAREGLLAEAALVAVELGGLPGPWPTLWLAWGRHSALADFLAEVPEAPIGLSGGRPTFDPAVLSWWDEAWSRAEAGRPTVSLPNVVLIGAEDKAVLPVRQADLDAVSDVAPYQAVVRYDGAARGSAHLESAMGTLRLTDPERFLRLEAWIPRLKPGLSLRGFTEGRRPRFFLAAEGVDILVDHLSAGERSTVINLVTVLRGGARGALVLVDEPELHLHLSLLRGNVAALAALAASEQGQLVVASHAPEVWRHFEADQAFVELPPRAVSPARLPLD
jgi:hypothetical protein